MNTTLVSDPQSSVFTLTDLATSRGVEKIVVGGRKLFPRLPKALEGVKTIVVYGWGKQAPAQSQNLHDSLKEVGSDIVVKIALRPGSDSLSAARAAGFTEEAGTLGTPDDLIPEADMLLLLIKDGAQTENWECITGLMKAGSTLCLSHGFIYGHITSIGKQFRDDINIILMAPKGMGDSVRKLYEQGRTTEGAGINSSVAVLQDVDGRSYDRAIAWAVATGSPVTFFTTMRNEYVSDLTGERGILLGLAWALVESLYQKFVGQGLNPKQAFLVSTKGLTSTVVEGISKHGLLGFYRRLDEKQSARFRAGYEVSHPVAKTLTRKIYESVASGEEIKKVVAATAALKGKDVPSVETSDMWKMAREAGLFKAVVPMDENLAFTAGMYVGALMAGMEVLIENGHCVSEAVNEQCIEATDSLMPYMDFNGLDAMVGGCSWTARLGTHEWGPVGLAEFSNALLTPGRGSFAEFLDSPLHDDIRKLFVLRPTVKLFLS